MKNQVIPLYNFPNNTYTIVIEIEEKNTTFNLFFSYNLSAPYWTLEIQDVNKNPIVSNIPLLSGHNLLDGLEYLEIGELYLFTQDDVTQEVPDSTNLDSDYFLVWRG